MTKYKKYRAVVATETMISLSQSVKREIPISSNNV